MNQAEKKFKTNSNYFMLILTKCIIHKCILLLIFLLFFKKKKRNLRQSEYI